MRVYKYSRLLAMDVSLGYYSCDITCRLVGWWRLRRVRWRLLHRGSAVQLAQLKNR